MQAPHSINKIYKNVIPIAIKLGHTALPRPLFEYLRDAVRPGGTLIYETFMVGNEALGRPRSPDFLLCLDELADTFADWHILAHQQGPIHSKKNDEITAIKQSVVTQKPEYA